MVGGRAEHAARVAMLVRGDGLAASMSDWLARTIEATDIIDVQVRTTLVGGHAAGKLEELRKPRARRAKTAAHSVSELLCRECNVHFPRSI